MLKRNCQNTCKNSIKTSIFLVCLISTLFVFFNQKVFAASNDTISFQGKIVRNDAGYEGLNVTAGNPSCVVSGASNDTCDFQVKYYDGPTGGAVLLGTEDFANEEIGEFGGVFNLALGAGSWSAGSESTFTDVFNNNSSVYVELKFAPDGTTLTETFSRMQVRSSAYAIRAGTADRADIANEADDAFQFDSAADATGYTPSAGMVYYDSDESTLKLYNGASWEDITSGTSGSSLFTDAGDYTYLTNTGDSFVLGASSYTEIGTETYSTHLTGLDTETTPFAWDVDAQRLVLDGSGAKAGMTVYSNYDGADEWPLVTLKTEHSGFIQPVLEISQDGTGPATSMYYGSSKIFEVGTQLEGAVRKAVVGIGVDTPDERLDVNGAIHIHDFTPSTTTNRLYSVASTLYWNGSELGAGGGLWTDGGTFSYLTSTTDDIVLGTNTTTNAPFFFDVSEGAFVINGTGTGNLFTVNDELSDSSPFVVDASGNVGIGTSSPTAKLDIAGTSSTISNNSGDITITADESVIVKADDANADNIMEWQSSTGGILAYVDSYGKLVLSEATASTAQLRLISSAGTDVASPVSGDLWWNGTELYFNDGSENVGLLTGNGFTDGVATSEIANAEDAVAFTFNTSETFSHPTSKLFSIMNNSTEKMYLDASGNLYVAGSIISDKGLSVGLVNNTGATVAERALVTLDTDNNGSFETTTTQNQEGVFGVVTGVDVNNDTDKDGNCDNGDTCIVAFEGVVEVTTVSAASASRGDYIFSSTTAGSAMASSTQGNGLIGAVVDITNAASGYVKMVFDEQNRVNANLYLSVDKNLYHDVYRVMADDYNAAVLSGEYDEYQNVSEAIGFDTFADELKINSNTSTISLDTEKGKIGLWGGRKFDGTNVDTDGNKYLGASDANDTYYYDRSQTGDVNANQDSTPETLVDLGIDPYWYNGVSLETNCTYNCSKESNLSTSYNGGLFSVTGTYATASEHGSIDITIVGQGTSSITADISSSDGNCTASGATLTFGEEYSFIAGSCSGSSIKITPQRSNYSYGDTFKIGSWYVEPATANDRGSKQAFPIRSYIIGTDDFVDIIDADTQKLWMRFEAGTDASTGMIYHQDASGYMSSVEFSNGSLYVTETNASSAKGLFEIDFLEDNATQFHGTNGSRSKGTTISERNTSTAAGSYDTNYSIVSIEANDVSTAVIPNHPTKEVTVSGWGYIQGDDTDQIEETVSFPYTFDSIQNIVVANAGVGDVGEVVSLEDCLGQGVTQGRTWGMEDMSSSDFLIEAARTTGVFGSSYDYCYTWEATGTVSPRTYTAVATDGGTSVLNQSDRSVVDFYDSRYTDASAWDATKVALLDSGDLYYVMDDTADDSADVVLFFNNVGGLTSDNSNDIDSASTRYLTIPKILRTENGDGSSMIHDLVVRKGTSTIDSDSNTLYITTDAGVTVLQEKQGNWTGEDGDEGANGSVKYYTKDYISEEMIGDIRGVWGFNNNTSSDLDDLSVLGNDLTNNNSVTFTSSGVRGNAASFNGTNQYLSRADDSDFEGMSDISFGAWVKTTDSNGAVITKDEVSTRSWALAIEGDKATCFIHAASDYVYMSDAVEITDDEWHYLACTLEGGVVAKLYVDGVEKNSDTSSVPASIADSTARLLLGDRGTSSPLPYAGLIDEPFVTAEALTASQIKRMYQTGKRALEGSHSTNDYKNNLSDDGTGTGGTNISRAIGVDGNGYMYVGMDGSGADDGWVSKIDLNSDTQVDQYTTSTDIALADNDVKTIAVSPSGLELVGTDGVGVQSIPHDSNGNNSSGVYYSKKYEFSTNIDKGYLWMSAYKDSSDSSSDITVSASNDGGSNYVTGVLTNTSTKENIPEYEYMFDFSESGNEIIVKLEFANSSTYHTPVYVEQWGIAHMDITTGGGNGLFTQQENSVSDGSYVELVHGQNTYDMVVTGWVYDEDISKWVEIKDTENTVKHNLSNQWNDADADGVIRSDVRLTNVELSPGIDVGTGADGDITVSSNTNINTTNLISGRTCTDGGDAVNYNITAFNSAGTEATLSSTPSTGCLVAGDEVLIINLQGTSSAYGNVGNYETLEVLSVSTNTVTFKTAKTKYYGDTLTTDNNFGTTSGTQRVMLQRVPNYDDVTVNSSMNFYPSDWDGSKGGVIFFRASGIVTVTGTIHANGAGYRGGATASTSGQNGESIDGYQGGGSSTTGTYGAGSTDSTSSKGTAGDRGGGGAGGADVGGDSNDGSGGGGGGGYGTSGGGGGGGADSNNGGGSGGGDASLGGGGGSGGSTGGAGGTGTAGGGTYGGAVASSSTSTGQGGGGAGNTAAGAGGGGGGGQYGYADLRTLAFGSGGGQGGYDNYDAGYMSGGSGGGIVRISADTVTVSGGVSSQGDSGSNGSGQKAGGGSGAGGSIRIDVASATLGTSLVNASGGAASSATVSAGGGGEGGSGRIAIYYADSITGTTSPTYSTYDIGYYGYGIYHSPAIPTIGANTYGDIRWEEDIDVHGDISVQTRSGSANRTYLDFDGSNDYIDLGNPSELQITGDQTIEMWLKPNSLGTRQNPYAKAYGGEGTIVQESDGGLNYYYGTAGGNSSPYQTFGSVDDLVQGEWTHIALVRDLTNMKLYWYINGTLDNQADATYAAAVASSLNAYIGKGYVDNYNGSIDDVRIWNTARTQTEIQNNMNSDLTGSESGLVGYWKLDTGSGMSAIDSSSSDNTGTIYGATWDANQTWEAWKPYTSGTNYIDLETADDHNDWSETNADAHEGDITRSVEFFEDEDEDTMTKITNVDDCSDGGYIESTISSTDISGYDYITAWVRASQTGNTLKIGFGESAGSEQDEEITIDAANTWQKVYWDLSDIVSTDRDGVTKIRITNETASANEFYVDNIRAEKLLYNQNQSNISSTPNDYLQYRVIFTTTNLSYQPKLENITFTYSTGYKLEQTDANTVRLYNSTGSTQKLRIDAVVGATVMDLQAPQNSVSLSPSLAQVDYQNSTNSIWINKTGTGGNFLKLQNSGTDKFVVTNEGNMTTTGNIVTEGTLSLGTSGDQGSIRYNATDDVIEFSNDGSTWLPLGAATAKIILSPEYSGAVLTADGTANTGTMTSDSDANSKNYYEWNSSEVSLNDYDVRVRFTLPSDFDSWESTALTLNFVTEDTGTNSKADIYLYLASSGTVDDSAVDGASSSGGTWTSMSLQSADLNECDAANETCMLIIRMYSANDNYVRVGDIELNYNRSL